MLTLFPMSTKLLFALWLFPIFFSGILVAVYGLAPSYIVAVAEALSPLSSAAMELLTSYDPSSSQRSLNSLVIATNGACFVAMQCLLVVTVLRYRRHIPAYLRARFGMSPKEWTEHMQGAKIAMFCIGLIAAADLKWGGASLYLLQRRVGGDVSSFPRVLFMSSWFFLLLNSFVAGGLQMLLYRYASPRQRGDDD
jgi:hypothetical protein